MFVSPWLLAAAVGILTLIIVIFAANNIQREKGLMTNSLFHKGQSLIRFVEAGMRASMISSTGMMHRPDGWIAHTQQLVEQAAVDPDILYIAVLDDEGRVLTHSDPDRVGLSLDRDLDSLRPVGPGGSFHVVSLAGEGRKAFEVVNLFEPFRRQRGRFRQMWQQMLANTGPGSPAPPGFVAMMQTMTQDHYILVGLDMTELEKTIHQYRLQILFLSLSLLFVGLGGWVSLMAVQAYRISQDSLHRIQAFTGQLISRLPVGIIATDAQGRIKTFNEAAAAMTGCEVTAGINQPPAAVLPESVAAFFDPSCGADSESATCEQEISLTTAKGTILSLHLCSVPVVSRDEGEYMGRVLLMYDLSELKQLEKKVQRHERLVALGKMAAGVAHEVRNPLSSIKGFATLLGARFDQGSREQEAAELMVREVERLNRSITELLDYARPTPLKQVPMDLEAVLGNSLRLVAADAESLGVAVRLDCAPELPRVSADPDRLNQVLLNLYLNALQAMEEGGVLTVTAGPGRQDNMVDITVRDSGCGIPEELLERILDPYFTTKSEGTGLGLAMAYKIIDEHGGTIQFTSRVGEGTVVTVSLPVAEDGRQ